MAVIALLPAIGGGAALRYSLPMFLALHPAIPPASIPAIFDLGRTLTLALFSTFSVLNLIAAILLFRLNEWGRRAARAMALVGIGAATFVVPVRSFAGAFTVAAVVAPYVAIFLYLGRDYVNLRFQMAREGGPPAPKMFRPDV
jgi:hypothetical protein